MLSPSVICLNISLSEFSWDCAKTSTLATIGFRQAEKKTAGKANDTVNSESMQADHSKQAHDNRNGEVSEERPFTVDEQYQCVENANPQASLLQ